MRILALDFGTKRIGVAMSDELFITAQGSAVIERKGLQKDLEEIARLVKAHDVIEIVVGLPLNMDGTRGAKTVETMEFVGSLSNVVSVPVKTYDERLTSLQAERMMLEADMSRAKRRKLSDKVAAQIILQAYLDARKRG